jgi:hemerythrin-like domain-containing protein
MNGKGTIMGIQIGAKPDCGFDDPLGMLKDCHRRVERFLGILCLVVERAQGRELTGEESTAAEAALHYFREGGQRHTADEEESLFPRLRAASARAEETLSRLESDHQDAGQLHDLVEKLYRVWIARGTLSSEETQELLSATCQLRNLYVNHSRIEETEVFPFAAKVLDSQSLTAIGSELEARRK